MNATLTAQAKPSRAKPRKTFQKEIAYEQDWHVRGMRAIGGKPHVALKSWDAVALAPVPRGVELNPGQQLQLGPDKASLGSIGERPMAPTLSSARGALWRLR